MTQVSQRHYFFAGQIQFYLHNWKEITSDPFILDLVRGSQIPITNMRDVHEQSLTTPKNEIKKHQGNIMDEEVQKLIQSGVIERSEHEEGEIISSVFLVEKNDKSFRMILNLKEFNKNVEYEHFKLENLYSAISLMKKDC